MAMHEHDQQSNDPLDISSLQNTRSVNEGAQDLLLGKSKHITLENGTAIDVYAAARTVSVETPLSSLLITGIEKVDASPDTIEFQAQREGYRATLSLLPNGEVVFHSMPVSDTQKEQTASETKGMNAGLSREQNTDFSREQAQITPPLSTSLSPAEKVAHAEQKQRVYQTKFNLGSDPFPITTTEGPMYAVLAYIREANGKSIPSEQSKAVKIAVSPQEQEYIISPAHINEQNSKGYLFRKGDFVKGALIRRDFVQIAGKPGNTKEVSVRGYAFTEPPSMLSPKQKPAR